MRPTRSRSRAGGAQRYDSDDWRDWWCDADAALFQFIGQDNIYFYCVAQPALWEALGWGLDQSVPVANYHILFMGKKASSSGAIKPPMARGPAGLVHPRAAARPLAVAGPGGEARELLAQAADPKTKDNPSVPDPALKESALLTNVFNRLARSCFYGAAKTCELRIPAGAPGPGGRRRGEGGHPGVRTPHVRAGLPRRHAHGRGAHPLGEQALERRDSEIARDALRDAFHSLRAATLLMHPAVPEGCEMICEYFGFEPQAFFSWDNALLTLDELTAKLGEVPGDHLVRELPPRTDFFKKHPSQFK